MKAKLDENLPESLMGPLTALGHDIDNVRQENLKGGSDGEIWEAAQADARLLVTQDLDFSDIRKFAPGSHYGLLLLRLRQDMGSVEFDIPGSAVRVTLSPIESDPAGQKAASTFKVSSPI